MPPGATRLSGLDVAFLCLERSRTPMHLGAVAVFRPSSTLDAPAVADLLATRAAAIPALRSRVRATRLGGAEWAPAPDFRAADHVHAYRLPRDLLATYAAGWIGTPLDMTRPPWDLHVVDGLPGGDFAVLLKLHHALTDGAGALHLAAGLLDGPGATRAIPRQAQRTGLVRQVRETVDVAGSVLRSVRPPWSSTLTAEPTTGRRFGMVALDMTAIRRLRKTHGGTVNDVVLAIIAGGLRTWMRETGTEPKPIRALVPVNVRGRGATGGNQLSGYLCDLPVDEPDATERLRRVRETMDRNKRTGPTRGAGALPLLATRVPGLAHRLGTRLLAPGAPLLFDTTVTTVPFPSVPMTLAGATLREVYPAVPLAPGHCLGIAISPYRSSVHIGLTSTSTVDVRHLATAIEKAAAHT